MDNKKIVLLIIFSTSLLFLWDAWVKEQEKWPFRYLIYAFLAAFFPFGTFYFDKWLKKQQGA